MQRDIASALALSFAVWAADGAPPLGWYLRHACIADLNAGALIGTPLTLVDWPDPDLSLI